MTEQNLNQLQLQLAQKKAALARRFEEVARLTGQLEMEQTEVVALEQQLAELQSQAAAVPAGVAGEPFHLELTDEQRERNGKDIGLIAGSDLFDAEWYLQTYPDVAGSEYFSANPAAHYTLYGAFEGRRPCPEFDSSFYLRQNPDVAAARLNPLAHYLHFGRAEGRLFAAPVMTE